MALIKCSECGNEISDKATSCPHCGYPISIQTNDQVVYIKKEKSKIILLLKILAFIQIICFFAFLIFPKISATLTGISCCIAAVMCVPCLTLAIICLAKTTKSTNKKGRTTGTIVLILEVPLIILFSAALFLMPKAENSPTDILSEIDNPSASTSDIEITNNNSAITTGTDWNTYEPIFIGTIPVGCIMVADSSPENVSMCLQRYLGTTEKFSAKSYESKYIKEKMVIEDVLSIYGCTGTAIFNFDWNETLASIVFKFENGGTFTPELFNQLHDEISSVLGVSACFGEQYGLHKTAQNDGYYDCSWNGELAFECSLSCYFDETGKPDGGTITFERTITGEKANHSIKTLGRSDSIIHNGVQIDATYHGGSNPYVDGTVTNDSSQTVSFLKIKITLYDENDKVVDTTWTYAVGAEGLAPGESTQWKAYCSDAEAIKISVIE